MPEAFDKFEFRRGRHDEMDGDHLFLLPKLPGRQDPNDPYGFIKAEIMLFQKFCETQDSFACSSGRHLDMAGA
jgi:hypothetical protein